MAEHPQWERIAVEKPASLRRGLRLLAPLRERGALLRVEKPASLRRGLRRTSIAEATASVLTR